MTSEPNKVAPQIIIIRETMWQSIVSDAVSFCTVVGVIGVGWWLGSSAMQWAGFCMLGVVAFARAGAQTAQKNRRTIAEAQAYLSELAKAHDAPKA